MYQIVAAESNVVVEVHDEDEEVYKNCPLHNLGGQ